MKPLHHFHLSRRDRLGLLAVLSLLIAVVLVSLFLPRCSPEETPLPLTEEQRIIDSLQRALSAEKEKYRHSYQEQGKNDPETFVFDPNTADYDTFIRLGLKPWQARNALKYRAKGGRWKSPDDFARLYGLERKDFERLRPYIVIEPSDAEIAAAFYKAKPDTARRRQPKLKEGARLPLNEADTTAIQQIPGIGSYYAGKLVRYRERLGGFVGKYQLREVEGLPPDVERWFTLEPHPKIERIRVNHATFKELIRHPYLNYEQVKSIVNYIRQYGPLHSWQDLQFSKNFTPKDFDRLHPYFTFD